MLKGAGTKKKQPNTTVLLWVTKESLPPGPKPRLETLEAWCEVDSVHPQYLLGSFHHVEACFDETTPHLETERRPPHVDEAILRSSGAQSSNGSTKPIDGRFYQNGLSKSVCFEKGTKNE